MNTDSTRPGGGERQPFFHALEKRRGTRRRPDAPRGLKMPGKSECGLECGGKRSVTPLCERPIDFVILFGLRACESAIAAALCRRSP
jgi:hypothetical protein